MYYDLPQFRQALCILFGGLSKLTASRNPSSCLVPVRRWACACGTAIFQWSFEARSLYKPLQVLNDAHLQLIRFAYYYFGLQEVKTASTPSTPPPACIQWHIYCYVSGRGHTTRAGPFCHTSTCFGSIHDRLCQHAEMEIQAVGNNEAAAAQLYNADDEGEDDTSDATRRRIQCLVATVVRNTFFPLHCCHLQSSSLIRSIWFSGHQFFSHWSIHRLCHQYPLCTKRGMAWVQWIWYLLR